jgi:hypothetical protein
MAESVGSAVIELGLAIHRRYHAMAEADFTTIKVSMLAKHVAYALEEAQERGSLESPSESFRQDLDATNRLLQQLDAWIENYMSAGRNQGKLVRLCDYFNAGTHLDVLKKMCEDLDRAAKAMGLALKVEACAAVNDVIEQQSSIAQGVIEALKQHTGGASDGALAAKVAKMTRMAVGDVQRELSTSMEALRRVENRSQYIKDDLLQDLSRRMGGMKITASLDLGENPSACLEAAPLAESEWVNDHHGRLMLGGKCCYTSAS